MRPGEHRELLPGIFRNRVEKGKYYGMKEKLYADAVTAQEIIYIACCGEVSEEKDLILDEHQMDVYVNEQLVMQIVCVPSYLEELVLGRLFTEGFIRCVSEVQKIYICEQGRRARVFLNADIRERIAGRNVLVPTCCTDNQSVRILDEVMGEPEKIKPYDWKPEWIFKMSERFFKGTKLHRMTRGTHSCFLGSEGEILFECEDIGRHNALDKAVGYALKNGVPLQKTILYTSGRVPADMVRKTIRAGVPVFVSKAVPTRMAVELARMYGVTLIGSAREEGMKVYTDFRKIG